MNSLGKVNHSVWQLSEDYLNPFGTVYDIESYAGNRIYVRENPLVATPWKHVALKVASYATVIIPLTALAVRTYYRWNLEICATTLTPQERYIEKYENWPSEPPSPLKKAIQGQGVAVQADQLDQYLADYQEHIPELTTLTYQVLDRLIKEDTAESLQDAKRLQKKLAAFYRQSVLPDAERSPQTLYTIANATGYYASPDKLQLHALFFELRRQIKIRKKFQGTDEKVNSLMKLTFMHGSQSFVLERAIQTTEGALVPSGELRKTPMCGEMEIGSQGINIGSLSGTPLYAGGRSYQYANNFAFDIPRLQQTYQTFMEYEFSNYSQNVHIEVVPNFIRSVTAIKRLAAWDPSLIDREKIQAKLDRLDAQNRQFLHDMRWNPFSEAWGFEYKEGLNHYLKCLEGLRAFLNSPPAPLSEEEKEEILRSQPMIFASNRVVGITHHFYDNSELDYPGRLKIGDEITHVIAEDTVKATELLQRYSLQDRVTVVSLKEIDEVSKLNREHFPHVLDVFRQLKKT